MQRFRLLAMVAVLFGLTGQVAQAQATLFDGSALRNGCLQGQCETVVRAEVGLLQSNRIQGAAFNSQLAAMATLLFELAQIADPEAADQIARAMLLLAQFSTDAAQSNSLLTLASAISDGSAELFALDDPFAVSPN